PRPGPSGPAHPRARAVPADAAARHATDAAGAPRRLRLLFAGRLVERKGVAVLLRALAGMAPEDRPLAHVIGDGPLRDALQTQSEALGLADSVSFHGFVPEAELAAQYEACDAFVLPAIVDAKGDTEGLGVVLIEALAHGKPAIASRAGGIVDVVRDRETGLLVPPGDVEALRTAIRTLASDSALRIELGRRGRERVERDFAWPVIIERLTGLYGALAARESA
ncbi:MAG: glycosyltransferase family 4 protein, partial [Longimicrobiales bacterium]